MTESVERWHCSICDSEVIAGGHAAWARAAVANDAARHMAKYHADQEDE